MRARHVAWLALAASAAACGASCGVDVRECAPVQVSAVTASADEVGAILERACSLGGCHLGAPGAGGLVLGRSTATWRAALVEAPSRQHPGMVLVAPGDPDRSWLVAKLDGSFCGATCDRATGCGGVMPPGAPLAASERARIIAWIADGAR